MVRNNCHPVVCVCLAALLCLWGCRQTEQGRGIKSLGTQYSETVASAREVLPEAVEMEKLFGKGEVDHFIEHFGLGDERWNSEVFFWRQV